MALARVACLCAAASCTTAARPRPAPPPAPPPLVNGWYPGPIIGTVNYSPGVVLYPQTNSGVQFDLTTEVDALVKPVTALPATMTITYDVSAPVTPSQTPSEAPLISIMFQRKGDNWSGRNQYQQYRWYAQSANVIKVGPGIFTVNFNSLEWSDVYGIPASTNPALFQAAKDNVESISITFGLSYGRSHGVVGPAHFNIWPSN